MSDKPIIKVDLEYRIREQVSDKNFILNTVVAIERQNENTYAVKLSNGYSFYVPPKLAAQIDALLVKHITDEVVTLKEGNEPVVKKLSS